jgi:formylglycine-generating enzyme required for sulfatase activity
MARWALVVLVLVCNGACSSRTSVADTVTDAAADQGDPADMPHGDLLPAVTPQGLRCIEVTAPVGAKCIPAGFFWMAYTTEKQEPKWPSNRPAYLDAYLLDIHEVTVRAYADYIKGSGATPPPEICGFSSSKKCDADPTAYGYVKDHSGWSSAGEPDPARLEHPVVCVTRTEAMGYCASKGGRLPTVLELMKAGRGAFPDLRRFPWGDTPPALDETCTDCRGGWSERAAPWVVMYQTCDDEQLHTKPAGALAQGASPFGIRGLAGNVSEFVLDCSSEFDSAWSGQRVIVRPQITGMSATHCGAGVFGNNWRMRGFPHLSFDWLYGPTPTRTPLLGYLEANDNSTNHPFDGSSVRSWRLGFRCAYDLK